VTKRRQIAGQVNLLTRRVEGPIVVVSRVDEERGVVTIRSVEDPTRSAHFTYELKSGNRNVRKIAGWLTPAEFRQAVRIAKGLLSEGDDAGRFS